MQATIVFEKIWNAINELTETGQRKYRYIILEGSSRSSKTHSALQCYYLYGYSYEGKRLSAWRDTKKDARDTLLNDMNRAFPTFEQFNRLTFHKTESIFTFPTKSKIEIHGCDDDEKVHGFQGDVIWINEPYKVPKEVFDQLDMRTSDFVIIDWNPKKSHWIDELKKDSRAITIHSTFKDNPFCPEEQRIKILSYQPLRMSDAVISGLLSEANAKSYDIEKNALCLTAKQIKEISRCRENERKGSASDFSWSVYGLGLKAEKPNRIFKWIEIPDDIYHALKVPSSCEITGVDWGAVDPWGILDAKYYDGTLYLHERNYLSENKLREKLTATELAQISESEEGFITWYFNKFGIPRNRVIVCDSNRPAKIIGLRRIGYEYAIAAVKGAGSIVDGIDGLNSIKVCFTSSSVNLRYEQENYSRKVDRYGIVLEEPEDIDNHLIDPARYIYAFLKQQGIIKNI